ncbi:MAG: hypothetical protein ACE5E7_02285 [Anaerolineae bacterium]
MRLRWILFLILLALLVGNPALPAHADVPTNVGLVSFDVIPLDNAVRITWSTATELGTAGFMIKRRTEPDGTLDYLQNIGFITSLGNPTVGADYEVTDDTAVNGITYTYQLVEIEANSNENPLDHKTVTVGAEPTSTPITIGGGNTPTATSPPPRSTATRTPTATPSPTATSASSATRTPTTTPTRMPRLTATPTATLTPVPTTAVPTTEIVATASTNSSDRQEGNRADFDNNIVLAQEAQQEATAESGYPGPTATTPPVVEDNSYPAQQEPAATNSSAAPSSYPAGSSKSNPPNGIGQSNSLPVVGGDTGAPSDAGGATTQSTDASEANRGRFFLWGGFIIALLIFITSIVGSILLYTRRAS